MKCCIQRVDSAYVEIDEKIYSQIGKGLLVLVSFFNNDEESYIDFMSKKVCGLRIFENDSGKMDLSVQDIDGELLIVSQFTLAGESKKGMRPDFINAMHPEKAIMYYEKFIEKCKNILGVSKVKTGVFGSKMKIGLVNNGPVTIILEKQ